MKDANEGVTNIDVKKFKHGLKTNERLIQVVFDPTKPKIFDPEEPDVQH